ncbi:hypothetical protein [Candidatus Hodgkinia cicadicola]
MFLYLVDNDMAKWWSMMLAVAIMTDSDSKRNSNVTEVYPTM